MNETSIKTTITEEGLVPFLETIAATEINEPIVLKVDFEGGAGELEIKENYFITRASVAGMKPVQALEKLLSARNGTLELYPGDSQKHEKTAEIDNISVDIRKLLAEAEHGQKLEEEKKEQLVKEQVQKEEVQKEQVQKEQNRKDRLRKEQEKKDQEKKEQANKDRLEKQRALKERAKAKEAARTQQVNQAKTDVPTTTATSATAEALTNTTAEAITSTTAEAITSTTAEAITSTTAEAITSTTAEAITSTTAEAIIDTTAEVPSDKTAHYYDERLMMEYGLNAKISFYKLNKPRLRKEPVAGTEQAGTPSTAALPAADMPEAQPTSATGEANKLESEFESDSGSESGSDSGSDSSAGSDAAKAFNAARNYGKKVKVPAHLAAWQKIKKFSTKKEHVAIFACSIGVAAVLLSISRSAIAHTLVQQGYLAQDRKDAAQSAFSLTAALLLEPDMNDARLARARAYAKLGKNEEALADLNQVLQSEPDNIEALQKRASVCLVVGKFDLVVADCSHIIRVEKQAQSVYTYSNRAVARYMLGQPGTAIKDYSRAISMSPRDSQLFIGRADCYRLKKDYERAVSDYNKACSLNPKSTQALLGLANSEDATGHQKEALQLLNKSIASQPTNVSLLIERASLLAKENKFKEATADLTQAIKLNGKAKEPLMQRAYLYGRTGQLSLAINDIDRALKLRDEFGLEMEKGELLLSSANYKGAVAAFGKASELSPQSAEAFARRAEAQAQLKNYQAAVEDIGRAIALHPTADLYYQKAIYDDAYGNKYTRESDLKSALALNPHHEMALLMSAKLSADDRNYVTAIEFYSRVLSQDAHNAEALHGKQAAQHAIGSMMPVAVATNNLPDKKRIAEVEHLVHTGSFEQLVQAGYDHLAQDDAGSAVKLLAQAIRLNPNSYLARSYMVHALVAIQDISTALGQFKVLEKLDPGNEKDIKFFAQAMFKNDNWPEAIRCYTKLLALTPEDAHAWSDCAIAYQKEGLKNQAKSSCLKGLESVKDEEGLSLLHETLRALDAKPAVTPTATTTAPTPGPGTPSGLPNTEG